MKAAHTSAERRGLTYGQAKAEARKILAKSKTPNLGKAQELYQMDQAKGMGEDFKGITATRKELREGYFHTAKLIVLRGLYLQNKGLSGNDITE